MNVYFLKGRAILRSSYHSFNVRYGNTSTSISPLLFIMVVPLNLLTCMLCRSALASPMSDLCLLSQFVNLALPRSFTLTSAADELLLVDVSSDKDSISPRPDLLQAV